ncbi:MAG TPA: FtsX-like permease family protein [Acidimicrobiales bacterium]|nr:FtsX-like permease family protein [Acidimicrobiales bacterium]
MRHTEAVFPLTYAAHELRRRVGRTILTALGLAAGVGLVIGIVGVSDGLDQAQGKVLAPLRSVGTDVLVTRVAGAQTADQANGNGSGNGNGNGQNATNGQGGQNGTNGGQGANGGGRGGGFFGGGGGGAGIPGVDQADALALANENKSVTTDLAKLGKPGDHFVHDFFVPGTQISFPQEAVVQATKTPGVTSAVGGLSMQATHQTGTVPQIVAELQTGGEQVQQTVMPPPLTDAERQQVRACIATEGGVQGGGGGGAAGGGNAPPEPGGGGGGGLFGAGGRGRFEQCLPPRFQQYIATFTTPLRTVRQALDPPSTDIQSTPYTAAGVDPAHPDEGLITSSQVTAGRWYKTGATDEVLLNVSYANANNLKVGSDLPVNGTTFHVVGLVSPTLRGQEAGVYFPLGALQQLSGHADRVNVLLVKAKDAGSVDAVASALRKQFPGAQVVTTKDLADQVTGSLKDAKKLADQLGGILAIIVLGAAFVIAVLLTLSSVAKRVREIGTLRAIGWSKRMVVRQMLTETLGIGVLGAVLGVIVGLGALAAISALSPSLTTSQPVVPSAAASSLARIVGRTAQVTGGTTTIHLHAPVSASNLVLGMGFAIIGGLIAGAVGGWRAARLRPARALADIG